MRRDPRFGPGLPRRVAGFRRDGEGWWVAELECGHTLHLRHDPPWQSRPWVLTAAGRDAFLGRELECAACAGERPEEAAGRVAPPRAPV